jgi:hypothetical protein
LLTSISIHANTQENYDKIVAILTEMEKNSYITPDAKAQLMEIAQSSLQYIDDNRGLLELFGLVVPTTLAPTTIKPESTTLGAKSFVISIGVLIFCLLSNFI